MNAMTQLARRRRRSTRSPGAAAAAGQDPARLHRGLPRRDDEVFALDDRCPHKGGPLSQGIVHGHSRDLPAAQLGDLAGDRRGARPRRGLGAARTRVRVEAGRILLDAARRR